jgi:hypothetical protein
MLHAIAQTSAFGNGGSQQAAFSAAKAAKIAAWVIPRRRMVPANEVKVLLRWPAGIRGSADGGGPGRRDFGEVNRARSQSGIGAKGTLAGCDEASHS